MAFLNREPRRPSIDFDNIRARHPISSIAGPVVKLYPAGRELKACCPFHPEKSASFTIFAGDHRSIVEIGDIDRRLSALEEKQ